MVLKFPYSLYFWFNITFPIPAVNAYFNSGYFMAVKYYRWYMYVLTLNRLVV